MSIYKKLLTIQQELKAPKNQYNAFGKYYYRSCEDILEGLKPILKDNNCVLKIDDELEVKGERYYVSATATLIDAENGETIDTKAYAREAESKKGMDESQVSGATSSYARKYALNGLFCIDDVKDADSTNTHGQKKESKPQTPQPKKVEYVTKEQTEQIIKEAGNEANFIAAIKALGYKEGTKSSHILKQDYEKLMETLKPTAEKGGSA